MMVQQAPKDRTASVRQANFRQRRRLERGRAFANRLKDPDIERVFDPDAISALKRMGPKFTGELTELQIDAGELVGRIYGEYERASGKSRSAKSPQYERAYGRPEISWPDEKCARAKKRYEKLEKVLERLLPSPAIKTARAVIETLCVDNQPIAAASIPGVAVVLQAIAEAFELVTRRRRSSVSPITSTSRRPPRRDNARARRAANLNRDAWERVERQFDPQVTPDQLEQKWRAHQAAREHSNALADRESFREQKRRRRA